ncbi:MAG: helix-turn-helix transcriptional regulator [Anaerolineae bacterium]|nr:helix-turn-helix transcriptional regulator [Anaerolineae bacterium]
MKRRWGRRMRIVEPMMLLLLANEPVHGYRLVERLDTEFGVNGLPPQTVYRALQDMEEREWVRADWDISSAQGPPRKVYRLTENGWAALDTWSLEIEDLRRMLDTFLESYRRERST